MHYRIAVALCTLLLVVLTCQNLYANCNEFASLMARGSYGVSKKGELVSECRSENDYVPASIIKVITADIALDTLGENYRFPTELYLDKNNNLYIKGYGEPFLVSETVGDMVKSLKPVLSSVNSIFIDDSVYALEEETPGSENSDRPYDAPVTSTAVNFNSIPFQVKEDGTVTSSELQTPTLELMKTYAQGKQKGRYRINICVGGCNPEAVAAQYTGELFRACLLENAIAVQGNIGRKMVPEGSKLLLRHLSEKTVKEYVWDMLHSSSNFIANQLFLVSGMKAYGAPATWSKARRLALNHMLQNGFVVGEGFCMVDGAGLSRQNRLNVRTLLKVLDAFQPHAGLLRQREGVLVKSGTLKGVYNYSGYLADGSSFVLMLNQQKNTRKQILALLKKKHPFK